MKRFGLSAAFVTLGLTVLGTIGVAHARKTLSFRLQPASATIATCLPHATADVTVVLKTAARGVDTLHLDARGLPPNTTFAVFLTQNDAFATPPFGAVEYIGAFTTNQAGKGSLKVEAIIAEAFASTVVGSTRGRADLEHLVFWFADPAAADFCFAPAKAPITPFDGDGVAGPAAMSSQGPTGPCPVGHHVISGGRCKPILFTDDFEDGIVRSDWQLWRKTFVETQGRMNVGDDPRPGFNYGHSGNGRDANLATHIGDVSWTDYRLDFDLHVLPAGAFNPFGLTACTRLLNINFRVQDAKESWNDPASTLYSLGIVPFHIPSLFVVTP
jgi:hypothetical protein